MSRRPPSAPPTLPGFEHVKLLGTGGFADVFLYQQQLPRRQVAVKVLLADHTRTQNATAFATEANLMAQFATHPSIVSVYEAGVSGDGRPYLVMEYCSKPNLQARHRRERFSEAETLRIGVQIAGAVETAHRAGILHRDIKPANILVTDYGRPALTDFGISATTTGELNGLSVPWSPPESLAVPPRGDASSDVYSLAATLYTLLTNRSPFEIPGASNTERDLVVRVESMPVPPLGRDDVSPALEAVLARAMAKRPEDRYRTALEFARALQRVQIGLGMQATPVDVIEDELDLADEDDDDGRTRFRGITSIDAQGGAAQAPTQAPTQDAADRTVLRPVTDAAASTAPAPLDSTVRRPFTPAPVVSPPAPPVADTVRRADDVVTQMDAASAVATTTSGPRRGRTIAWAAGAAAAVIAAVIVIAVVMAPQGGGTPHPSYSAQPVDPVAADTVPQVTKLAGTAQGASVVFTWTNPDPKTDDVYLWRDVVPGQTATLQPVSQPTVTVPADASGRTCIEVFVRRADGRSTDSGVQGCAP